MTRTWWDFRRGGIYAAGSLGCAVLALIYFINGLTVPSGKAVVGLLDSVGPVGQTGYAEGGTVLLETVGLSRWEATLTRSGTWGVLVLVAVLLGLVAIQVGRFGARPGLWLFTASPFLAAMVVVAGLLTVLPGYLQAVAGAVVIEAVGAADLYEPVTAVQPAWLVVALLLAVGYVGTRDRATVGRPLMHSRG